MASIAQEMVLTQLVWAGALSVVAMTKSWLEFAVEGSAKHIVEMRTKTFQLQKLVSTF